MVRWLQGVLVCVGLCAVGPLHAITATQVTPGITVAENANGDARASAIVLPGVGSARLLVRASTEGTEAALADASRSLFGAGVVRSRLGGIGDPQIVRASIQLDALLA